jgi:hypothetical protein
LANWTKVFLTQSMFPNLGSDKNRKNRVSEPGNYAVPFAPPRIASFAPAHVALRVALRQGWFAFLPECLTLRATHVAYRVNPRLLGSQPAPAGMCSREPSRDSDSFNSAQLRRNKGDMVLKFRLNRYFKQQYAEDF